jgi:predicted dienelactone hydrolase
MEYQHHLTHVSSWGFVVVAPVHDERGLLTLLSPGGAPPVDEGRVLLDALEVTLRASTSTTPPLGGLVREGPAIFGGHSAGTRAALAAATRAPERAAGLLQLSGGGIGREGDAPGVPTVPTLFVTGSTDEVIPLEDVRSAFDRYAKPKKLIVIVDAGHLSLTDLCTIGAEWLISEHAAVAFLRWRLGTDPSPAALTGPVLDAIGGARRTQLAGSLSP